ncbi:MAG: RsmB/NOP family class I SAM-dependent RNA methyltransferase [Burkholderiales bacterium]|nr:MAG: RsmB/NOP family class I SAM-dependent RNA methyltransferase [Burkholderiales bacterium]
MTPTTPTTSIPAADAANAAVQPSTARGPAEAVPPTWVPAVAQSELPRLTPPLLASTERAVGEVLQLDRAADTVLRGFFRANERLGRRDRGIVAETVFDVLRNRRRYGHQAQSMRGSLPRRLTWLSFVLRFGEGMLPALRPDAEDEAALRRSLASDPGGMPQPVRLSLPDWLHAELLAQAQAAGEAVPHAAVERLGQSLLGPAPLDLRVNLLKTDRETLRASLAADGVEAEAVESCDTALRVRGKPAIDRLASFERGEFEVQDLGSQRLVEFAAPRRGQTVIDFCAGAGGKTLAIAAAMRSSGQVYACDVSTARLQRLKPRLARSGATSVQPFGLDSEHDPKLRRLAGRADLVLVDAPCSGTGTLRRNPELKWRMLPEAVDELNGRQTSILTAAARLVKRGGALVYATCSLLERENEAVAKAFSDAHPGFSDPVFLHIRPDIDGSDGFFAARWVRRE